MFLVIKGQAPSKILHCKTRQRGCNVTPSFGRWRSQHRRALDLTQDDLSQRGGCTGDTIRKIEADASCPSKEIAARLAVCLDIAARSVRRSCALRALSPGRSFPHPYRRR